MLRALIFDFDGVIVDSEPLIFELTRQMAAKEGWTVSREEYFRDYLALDDRGIVERLYQSHGQSMDVARRDELVEWKAREYAGIIRDGLAPMPGAVEFVRRAAENYPLAIASGSLRGEIEHLLAKLGLQKKFALLATADDVERSKPDPAVYLKALAGLAMHPAFQEFPLRAAECLAIEDAPLGVIAAHAAGMKCLALAHSRPSQELNHADWVFESLEGVDMKEIAAEFKSGVS